MKEKNSALIVGRRIKQIRLQKEVKLTEVSLKAGISKGLLSRIENERTIPSLPVLFSIINSLDESPASFFENMQTGDNLPVYLLIRQKDYQPLQKEEAPGFHYFSVLSHQFEKDTIFNVTYLELKPDAKRDMVTTDGMEYIYLADGEIDYRIGDEVFTMYKGDSLFFNGRLPHVKINRSGRTARIIVIYLLSNNYMK